MIDEETHRVRIYKNFAVEILERMEQRGTNYVDAYFTTLPLAKFGEYSHKVLFTYKGKKDTLDV